ncbi:uncharacterized protein LOC122091661 [Macadamia integrifolia]|uniref:uncharacterized protein LOC122091661 n=1 Tax=Macadamia integrifolia TaxID=60698 RepID=UPI001C4E86CA|nr:uncharacterized protein LOC122091661 [Macadamia integrifolia]
MESKYSAEMMKHLEKQREILMDSYRSMSHELHRLQVEEEMLMRKFYEVMSAQGVIKENENGEYASNNNQKEKSGDLVCEPSNQSAM